MTRTNTLNRRRQRRRWKQYVLLESRNVSARIYGVTIESPHSQFYRLINGPPSSRRYTNEYGTYLMRHLWFVGHNHVNIIVHYT